MSMMMILRGDYDAVEWDREIAVKDTGVQHGGRIKRFQQEFGSLSFRAGFLLWTKQGRDGCLESQKWDQLNG